MVNELVNSKEYISKSKIGELRKNRALKNVPLSEIAKHFDKCVKFKTTLVGVPFDKSRQRHVKYVSRKELELRVFKDYFRSSR